MRLFDWGEKRFARGIAKAMMESYTLFKNENYGLSEVELIKKTLSTRPGLPAGTLFTSMDDTDFWENVADQSFTEIIYLLVFMEYIEYMKSEIDLESKEIKETTKLFKEVILEETKKYVI